MLLLRHEVELVVESFGEGREELCHVSIVKSHSSPEFSYLRLSRIPLMGWHANLVEEAMQSLDDRRDLLRQVAGVHFVLSDYQSCMALISGPSMWRAPAENAMF